MKRLLSFGIIALFICMGIGTAENYVDPSGTCGSTTYSELDYFGEILGTYPSTNPGPSNAWVGMTYAGGFVYQAKNIASGTLARLYKINPTTGAIVDSMNFPFTGYVMGVTTDGAGGFWTAQWSPTNVVWHVPWNGPAISSFVPATAPYSCRTPMWDGVNLWVGANAGSNNTKLYKMTTTGTIVTEWLTGTVVGWYMGSEWNTQAPAGSEIFVVDNVGNTIKRLNVGATVTLNASVASPAASPDVAEGLAFDGEYLWHCGAYASAGVVWKLDDGIAGGPPPNVTIDLTPITTPIVIPPGGGSFDYNVSVINGETTSQTFGAWIMVQLPNMTWYGPALGPFTLTLPGSTTLTRLRTQVVPASAPAGAYVYEGRVGSYPATIWDTDSFPFTKSALDNGGSYVGEWSNSGQSFETAVTAAPADYILHGASPNPFNPTTTLSFALPQAGQVKLSVYNVAGRQVAELVNGYRDAGSHDVTFDASNLASGLYIYQLSAGDFNATGKMVLMK